MNFLIPGRYFTSVISRGDLGDNKKKIDFLNLNVDDIVLTARIVLEYGLKMEVKLEDDEQPCGQESKDIILPPGNTEEDCLSESGSVEKNDKNVDDMNNSLGCCNSDIEEDCDVGDTQKNNSSLVDASPEIDRYCGEEMSSDVHHFQSTPKNDNLEETVPNDSNFVKKLESFVESMDNMPRQPPVNGGIRGAKFANFPRGEISLKSGKSSNDAGGLQSISILGSQSETYSDRICNGYMDEPLDLTVKGKGTTPEDPRPVYITTNNIGETSSLLQLQEKFGTNSTIFDRIGARTSNHHGPSYGQTFFSSYHAMQFDQMKNGRLSPVHSAVARKQTNRISSKLVFCDASNEGLSRCSSKNSSPSPKLKPDAASLRCSCNDVFESLYQLAAHMQSTGHCVQKNTIEDSLRGDCTRTVRGQDLWLNHYSRDQAQRILSCMECSHSFSSLPELTIHMIQSGHYMNLIRPDIVQQRPGSSSSLDSSVDSNHSRESRISHGLAGSSERLPEKPENGVPLEIKQEKERGSPMLMTVPSADNHNSRFPPSRKRSISGTYSDNEKDVSRTEEHDRSARMSKKAKNARNMIASGESNWVGGRDAMSNYCNMELSNSLPSNVGTPQKELYRNASNVKSTIDGHHFQSKSNALSAMQNFIEKSFNNNLKETPHLGPAPFSLSVLPWLTSDLLTMSKYASFSFPNLTVDNHMISKSIQTKHLPSFVGKKRADEKAFEDENFAFGDNGINKYGNSRFISSASNSIQTDSILCSKAAETSNQLFINVDNGNPRNGGHKPGRQNPSSAAKSSPKNSALKSLEGMVYGNKTNSVEQMSELGRELVNNNLQQSTSSHKMKSWKHCSGSLALPNGIRNVGSPHPLGKHGSSYTTTAYNSKKLDYIPPGKFVPSKKLQNVDLVHESSYQNSKTSPTIYSQKISENVKETINRSVSDSYPPSSLINKFYKYQRLADELLGRAN